MDEEREGKSIPRRLKIAVALLLLTWIVVLVALSRLQPVQRGQQSAPLPIYPEAYDTSIRSLPDRGWRGATYAVALDYPSLVVFDYYDERMREQRWSRLDAPARPQWQVSKRDGGQRAVLVATWLAPDQLLRLDLQLIWERRSPPAPDAASGPHMQVIATMSRNLIPLSPAPRASDRTQRDQAPFAR